ncbi:MAG: DUF2835 domain-containing protein [Gammaproteobacteria bacterium]|nr:DUF2835 domain-containing protein [Gammaproteobacteria bacterium]
MASKIRFYLDISQAEYLRYYRGSAQSVLVQAEDGRKVRFPAANLRPFVSSEGVRGRFEISLDDNNSLLDICRLS